jgi:hypothetical protein
MSIVDHNGRPVAYGWNDIAAHERYQNDRALRLISDEEFERCFSHLFPAPQHSHLERQQSHTLLPHKIQA